MSLDRTRSFFVWLLVVALSLLGVTRSAFALDVQAPSEVGTWEPWELSIRLPPTTGNPFLDTEIAAIVDGPDGARKIEGFCDSEDGSLYRVRAMPTRPGRHRWRITVSRKGQPPARAGGQFMATASKNRGQVVVDPKHPFHFLWSGSGEHYFWNGTTAYLVLGWDDETIAGILDRFAALSVNRVRVALSGRHAFEGEGEPDVGNSRFNPVVLPWVAERPADAKNPGIDVQRFNLELFRKTERLLEGARKRDIAIALLFYVDGYRPGIDPFGEAGAGGEDERRYYRYAIARFAAFSNVMWDVANEYRHFRTDAWANDMGTLIHQRDPYAHLTSVHGHASFRFRLAPWADMALYQQWDDCGGYQYMRLNREVQSLLKRPIPQINDEYGYEDAYPGFGCSDGGKFVVPPARDADSRRRIAWEVAMAGGYQTAGERSGRKKGDRRGPGTGWLNGRGDAAMKMFEGFRPMVKFFTQFEWWKLEPAESLAAPGSKQVLTEPGRRIIVRLPSGGAARVTTGALVYDASWYDPRTGETKAIGATSGPVWAAPEAPSKDDWILWLERKGPGPAKAPAR